jgi:hypothetical protein
MGYHRFSEIERAATVPQTWFDERLALRDL